MAEKIKRIIMLLVIYIVMFWLGFRSGEIYNRSKSVEIIPANAISYYIIEKSGRDDNGFVKFYEANQESHAIIKIFHNEKIRYLLKQGNIQIYTTDGKRVY